MARASDTVLRIARTVAAVICVFTIENLFIDPWVQRRAHHKLPSFAPEAPGNLWVLIFMALSISVIFLVVCQVLLMRDAGISNRQKWLTGILVLAAAILSVAWFTATGDAVPLRRNNEAIDAGEAQKRKNVVLRWQASTTPNARYNVYRGPSAGTHPDRLNSAPIEGTTFTDTNAVSGQTYWYAVRAINEKGEESSEFSETSVKVP
jgi:hypothetical protein